MTGGGVLVPLAPAPNNVDTPLDIAYTGFRLAAGQAMARKVPFGSKMTEISCFQTFLTWCNTARYIKSQ